MAQCWVLSCLAELASKINPTEMGTVWEYQYMAQISATEENKQLTDVATRVQTVFKTK